MNKSPQRIRHEARLRLLDVHAVKHITPLMLRVTLAGDQLAGFSSPGYADHIKIFFPPAGSEPVMPVLGSDGLAFPADSPRPEMRDYTPRAYDAASNTLEVDFVLHGDGPASSWAAQAKGGQKIVIGGPRGSLVIPDAFDWYLLAGDETALPAISRRLEELPSSARAIAIIEVASREEEQLLDTQAQAEIIWVHRNGAEAGNNNLLLRRIEQLDLPEGTATPSSPPKAAFQRLYAIISLTNAASMPSGSRQPATGCAASPMRTSRTERWQTTTPVSMPRSIGARWHWHFFPFSAI
jgi:NADPH-dependent ferric siderophore reductase